MLQARHFASTHFAAYHLRRQQGIVQAQGYVGIGEAEIGPFHLAADSLAARHFKAGHIGPVVSLSYFLITTADPVEGVGHFGSRHLEADHLETF